MNNILLLTDFSDLSTFARSLADKVAKNTGAVLHVVKIIDVPSEVEINSEKELVGGMSTDLTPLKNEKESSEQKIKAWVSDLSSSVKTTVVYGRLLKEIGNQIQANDIELVVMGTHGVSGVQELISGSVTENVIIKNHVPVLSLKCDREDLGLNQMLLTGDFDPEGNYDLKVLKELQKVFGSVMNLLWVNTKNDFVTTEFAIKKMTAFANKYEILNTKFHVYNDQSVEEGIVNFSNLFTDEEEIGIIAVEKKKKSQLGYIFTGCQATSFVNHIFKPIVTYTKES